MKFGLFDSGEDGEHIGVGFIAKCITCSRHGAFFFATDPSDSTETPDLG